jgi:cytoskeletal protein RodZ
MFGFDRMSNQQYNQLPYEVYETVHEPNARRRRWFIRLSVALLVATLLVLGGVLVWHAFTKDDAKKPQTSQSGQQTQQGQDGSNSTNTAKPSEAVVQSPQQNTPLPAGGSASGLQPNTTENDSTVRKPE